MRRMNGLNGRFHSQGELSCAAFSEKVACRPRLPSWKAHQLTGDRKGTWSLQVTRNWRITFRIDQAEGEILDLDYEDYD